MEMFHRQLETCPERMEMKIRNETDLRGISPWKQWELLDIFQKDSEKKCQDRTLMEQYHFRIKCYKIWERKEGIKRLRTEYCYRSQVRKTLKKGLLIKYKVADVR